MRTESKIKKNVVCVRRGCENFVDESRRFCGLCDEHLVDRDFHLSIRAVARKTLSRAGFIDSMNKQEQKFQTRFNHWLKAVHKKTAAFELKDTRGEDSLNFKEVQNHQILALLSAKNGVFVYKISDIGMIQNPFDCFCLTGVDAFVVIKYPDFFCLIDVDDFVFEKESSNRKSLSSERAKAISFLVVPD